MERAHLAPTTELRHLHVADRTRLTSILDVDSSWETLVTHLKHPDNGDYLITSENVRILERLKFNVNGNSPSDALIDYWSTCLRKRPTLEDLVNNLNACKLYRAADFISSEVLGYANVHDHCRLETSLIDLKFTNLESKLKTVQPSAPNPTLQSTLTDSSFKQYLKEIDANTSLEKIPFHILEASTSNFNATSIEVGGCKIGEGAFGAVYKVKHDNRVLAVKVLRSEFVQQFSNEISTMSKFNNENLLQLLAISCDGPLLCLVFDYMKNGSLFACLRDATGMLNSESVRLNIAVGTARGLVHLHTFLERPLVHRDVKSDNILIDEFLNPKLADFGLARTGSRGSGQTTTRNMTENIIGTTVYMAPEAFRGDVSVKLDVFSYGVVLLELITGLLPFDEQREDRDILSYVEENVDCDDESLSDLDNVKDAKVEWSGNILRQLFKISKLATEHSKKARPTMVELLTQIEISFKNYS